MDKVNKSQLIDKIATVLISPKAAAGRALDAFIDAVGGSPERGVTRLLWLVWYFHAVRRRAARSGRNPQTGATIEIAAE